MSVARRSASRFDPADLNVKMVPMKRRHLRGVMRIENQVYPRPWSLAVFHSEIGTRDGSRLYVVAKVGATVAGYAGILYTSDDGHITNVAVEPTFHRHKIGTRLMLTLAQQARAAGAKNLTLEVRVSNHGAQDLYRRFGFGPVGIRTKYYENVEDAIVMWVHDIDTPEYAARMREIEAGVPGTTSWEGMA
jgi:[ribosomal protein S18]-alanine N-acetyltransferase